MSSLVNVQQVFVTSEVAQQLDYDSAYIIRIAKQLQEQGLLSVQDVRPAGKRNYIFNEAAVKALKKQFNIVE